MAARAKISAKHALTSKEKDFCKIYVAFGLKNGPEAYRRSYCIERRDGIYVAPIGDHHDLAYDEDLLAALPGLDPKEVSKKVQGLLKQSYIQAYIEEIGRAPGDHARDVLADQARFGSPGEARRASEVILKEEDKLGFREAVDRWAEILMEIGAEIEVPLPHNCPHCGKGLYASVLVSEMFGKKERD